MAALPSPTQVAGPHNAIYEAYYHQVDPNDMGTIPALEAARFLKKSRLSDVVLSKIWDLSDPAGRGFLDKSGLFVALKLVALAQSGGDINMASVQKCDAPPPKVGELPKISSVPPARPAAPSPALGVGGAGAGHDWSIRPHERDKYSQLFDSLQPQSGLIAGNKVKGVLMESKLPLETLGRIWDLADQDKDGMLDRHEFIVAMHLVYKALEKHAVPTTLPPELRARPARPPSRPPSRSPSRPPSRPPSPGPKLPPPRPQPVSNADLLGGLLDLSSPTQSAPMSSPLMSLSQGSAMLNSSLITSSHPTHNSSQSTQWVVSPAEKAQFDAQFAAADQDRDGFVSGAEIKNTFLETGLPQATLAHIWALCDTDATGKLSRGQFALAMWLVRRALRGEPPPPALAANMLPPTDTVAQTISQPEPVSLGPQPTPEMEAIAREVDALVKERLALEAEVQARQRDLTVKAGEADSLMSELDTLNATLKQLENQKGEAQKRLNDLKAQVDKFRSQVSAQESAAAETETEVASRRAAAQTLREKERALQDELKEQEALADSITQQISRTVLGVSQANIKLTHLEEQLSIMEQAITAFSTNSAAAHQALSLQPAHSAQHLQRLVQGNTPYTEVDDDKFANGSFGSVNGTSGAGFSSDPFAAAFPDTKPVDPFAPTNHAQSGFGSDPFSGSADPFAGDSFTSTTHRDAAASGGFDSDPFAVLHAPTRGDATPSPHPSLPDKKQKAPPPRPAPPRPKPAIKALNNTSMEFTEDPFKDYRYEDPFNIQDPFADVADAKNLDLRPTSVAGFETDDFFATNSTLNGSFAPPKHSGRVSAPPVAYDPFATRSDFKQNNSTNNNSKSSTNNNDSWAAWPNDSWADDAWSKSTNKVNASDDWSKTSNQKNDWSKSTNQVNASNDWSKPTNTKAASDDWSKPTNHSDAWSTNSNSKNSNEWKTDNWANKTDNWATDWSNSNSTFTDANKNLNETWPSNTLPSNKKEKSPKPIKLAKSLVHTIGGIGRTKQAKDKEKKSKSGSSLEVRSSELLPSEEQQWTWAANESKRLEAEAEARRRQEDAELQLALAISRQEK